MNVSRKCIALLGIAAGLAVTSLSCHAGSKDQDDEHDFTAGISFDSAEGRYGSPFKYRTDTTDLVLSKDVGDVTIAANLPFIAQNGPMGSIIVAGKPVIVGGVPEIHNGKTVLGKSSTRIIYGHEHGLGDVDVSAAYFFENENQQAPLIDVKFDVKLANGNASDGLGTGKYNETIASDISQELGNWLGAFSLSYTEVGKIPGANMKNFFLETVDLSYKFNKIASLGATFNNGSTTTVNGPAQRDITLYYGLEVAKAVRMQAYLLKGFTNGSPSRGFGISANSDF